MGNPFENHKARKGQEVAPSESGKSEQGGSDHKPVDIMAMLLRSNATILKAAESDIVWTPAWINLGEAPIFSKGTINVIQGKAGVHKSRLSETFCSLLLAATGTSGDFLGFVKHALGGGYYVSYIDTERNTKEHFPAAVQRIRERAGLNKKIDNGSFFPVSIKGIDRKQRLTAVKNWIEYVRGKMVDDGVGNWNLFVVLDVVTDCVASFNKEEETLALFDYLGNLCESHNATFLLIIHENPGSEKARGHTGTEAMNKADCQIQISYESGSNGEDSDLIKIRFLKTRNAARPKPLFLQYSKERNGLIAADPDAISEHIESRKKNSDDGVFIEALEDDVFNGKFEVMQKDAVSILNQKLDKSENTIKTRIDGIIERMVTINNNGKKCKLTKESVPGKPTIYRLLILNEEPSEENKANDEDTPF